MVEADCVTLNIKHGTAVKKMEQFHTVVGIELDLRGLIEM